MYVFVPFCLPKMKFARCTLRSLSPLLCKPRNQDAKMITIMVMDETIVKGLYVISPTSARYFTIDSTADITIAKSP